MDKNTTNCAEISWKHNVPEDTWVVTAAVTDGVANVEGTHEIPGIQLRRTKDTRALREISEKIAVAKANKVLKTQVLI